MLLSVGLTEPGQGEGEAGGEQEHRVNHRQQLEIRGQLRRGRRSLRFQGKGRQAERRPRHSNDRVQSVRLHFRYAACGLPARAAAWAARRRAAVSASVMGILGALYEL